MRVIRHQAEVIQVSCNSFQHADHPRPVRTNKLCLGVCIGPKIHDHAFTTLQSLQPVNALSQHLNFRRQAGSDLGFRLRPFGFFLSRLNSNKGTKCDIEIRAARTFAGASTNAGVLHSVHENLSVLTSRAGFMASTPFSVRPGCARCGSEP